jgi:hypothetical protein
LATFAAVTRRIKPAGLTRPTGGIPHDNGAAGSFRGVWNETIAASAMCRRHSEYPTLSRPPDHPLNGTAEMITCA